MFRRPSSVLSLAVVVGVVAVAWFAESRRVKEVPCELDHDELEAALLGRAGARDEVRVGVLAGRLSLLEAAARVRALDRAMPEGFWARFGRTRPDDSDHEYYCRQVIGYVTPTTDDDRSWELVLRLEAELREHLKNGTLRLPQTRSPIRVGLISPVEAK